MSYSEQDKQRILEQSRATLERTSDLSKARGFSQNPQPSPVVHGDPAETWKREMGELERAKAEEKERMNDIQQLHWSMRKLERDIAKGFDEMKRDVVEGMVSVKQLFEKMTDRIEQLEDEVEKLHGKLKIADARFVDLKATVDARGTRDAEIIDLPNPLKRVR